MQRIFSFILFSVLLWSCKKELDFEYHEIDPILVIESQLTQKGCETRLTFTTPMNEYMDTTHVRNADVILRDVTENFVIPLYCDLNGIFVSDSKAIIGHSYELEINYNDRVYTSSCEMRPSTEILNIEFSWLKMPYDYVAILEIKFKELIGYNNYYWIRLYRNDKAYKWLLCDNKSASDGEITQMTMTSRKNLDKEDEKDILQDGDIVRVDICTISKEMNEYLTALQVSSNGPQMFKGEFCLGYFLASDIISKTIVFHPDELKER